MKKLIMIPAISILVLASVQFMAKSANTNDGVKNVKLESSLPGASTGNNISSSVKKRFQQDFGSFAVVKWEKSGSYAKGTFNRNGSAVSAWYDKDAKLVGTSSARSFSDMPGKAREKINSVYSDYHVVSVQGFDSVRGNKSIGAPNWLVELSDGTAKIIVKVNTSGETTLVKKI
jgi:hypothetical protein